MALNVLCIWRVRMALHCLMPHCLHDHIGSLRAWRLALRGLVDLWSSRHWSAHRHGLSEHGVVARCIFWRIARRRTRRGVCMRPALWRREGPPIRAHEDRPIPELTLRDREGRPIPQVSRDGLEGLPGPCHAIAGVMPVFRHVEPLSGFPDSRRDPLGEVRMVAIEAPVGHEVPHQLVRSSSSDGP